MGNRPIDERDEIIDKVEELLIMGFNTPSKIVRVFASQKPPVKLDPRTAKEYIAIAHRRLRNRYANVDLNKVLKREIRDLDYMERMAWSSYNKANNSNGRNGALNSITKIKERRAKLLGFDTDNVNPGKAKTLEDLIAEADNDYAENPDESEADRIPVVGAKQTPTAGAVQAEPDPNQIRSDENGA